MKNSQMKEARFLRWHNARKQYAAIVAHIGRGGSVVVGSYIKSRIYRHAEQFQCRKDAVYVQRGKHWDSLAFSAIHFVE